MRIPPHEDLMEVYCRGKNERGKPCGQYLGRVQVSNRNQYTDFKCYARRCRTTNQVFVDPNGAIHRDEITDQRKLRAPVSPVCIEG